jgi:hypothetical protein
MSQGIIIRDGRAQRSGMDIPKGAFDCPCGAKFVIYHHPAHPEDVDEQIAWLAAELEKDHKRDAEHRDTYHFPR